MPGVNIKKDDTVKVLQGKDRGGKAAWSASTRAVAG